MYNKVLTSVYLINSKQIMVFPELHSWFFSIQAGNPSCVLSYLNQFQKSKVILWQIIFFSLICFSSQ